MSVRAKQVVGVVRDGRGRMTHIVGIDANGARWSRPVEEVVDNSEERWFYETPSGESMLISVRRVENEIVLWNDLQGWVTVPKVEP